MNEADHYTAQAKLDKHEDPFKDKHPKNYQHGVILETHNRQYKLFAKEYNFRELFVFVLKSQIEQKDKVKDERDRRQYNSVQRPQTNNETIYMKTEDNKPNLNKHSSQLNFYNQKVLQQNQSYIQESRQDETVNDSRISNHAINIENNTYNNNNNNNSKSGKRRHESVKIPHSKKHILTANDNQNIYKQNQNEQLQQNQQFQFQHAQNNTNQKENEQLYNDRIKQKNEENNNYSNQNQDQQNNDSQLRQSSVIRRKTSTTLNQINQEEQNIQNFQKEQKSQQNTQNIQQNLNNQQTKNDIPRPKSKNNSHRQSTPTNKQQNQDQQILNLSSQEDKPSQQIQQEQQQLQHTQINNTNNQYQVNSDNQQQSKQQQEDNNQTNVSFNQNDCLKRPSSRQKSQRPPSNHGRQSQKSTGRDKNNSQQQALDAYGNVCIQSNAAQRHRSKLEQRMEMALKQLNEEEQLKQQQSQQQLIINIKQEQLDKIQTDQKQIIQQDDSVKEEITQILTASNLEQLSQNLKPQTQVKRKVRKRSSSRLSSKSNKNQDTPLTAAEGIDDNNQSIMIQNKNMNISQINTEDLQNLNDLENVSLQIIKKDSPNLGKRQISRKTIQKRQQDNIIIIQTENEKQQQQQQQQDSVVQYLQNKQQKPADLTNQKNIKQKIQDVIDDRGSDLSENDISNQDYELFSPVNNLQLECQKVDSYTSALQLQTDLKFDNTSTSYMAKQEYQIHQRMRSTSHHQKFSSPVRERPAIIHGNIQIAASPARQLVRKFESNNNIRVQPKLQVSSRELEGFQQQIIQNNQGQQISNGQSNIFNLQNIQEQTIGLLKEGSKTTQGNEKLIEMIKNNLTQLQKFSANPLAQINNSQNEYAEKGVYERQFSKTSTNLPIPQNNSNGDIFHADASTRLQLLEKWENKFGKSQLDDNNQNCFDSYEWDREEEEFQNSPSKDGKPKSGAYTTNNIMSKTQQQPNPPNQNYGFEQQAKKISSKDLMKDLLQQPVLQTHFSQTAYKSSTNQELQMKKNQSEKHQQESEEQFTKNKHKKTQSQIQNCIPIQPVMFTQTSQITVGNLNEYAGQPINIIQNFNINSLNLLNVCGQSQTESTYCQSHQTCQLQNNQFTSTFHSTTNQQSHKLQQETKHLNILERIRMAHKQRGTNQSTQEQHDNEEQESILKGNNPNQQRQTNQSYLHLKSTDKIEMLGPDDPTLKMPKSSKGSQKPNKRKTSSQKHNSNKNLDFSVQQQQTFDNQDRSDTFSVNTKHSSSKTKIVLKASQVTKFNQPININSPLKMKQSSNNDLLSPSESRPNLISIKKTQFFDLNDINLAPPINQDNQSQKSRGKSSTPSPQKQRYINSHLQQLNSERRQQSNQQLSEEPQVHSNLNQESIHSSNKINNANQQLRKQNSNVKQEVTQNKPSHGIQNPNDTFDYNWDDETINNSIVNKNKQPTLKTKLALNSAKHQVTNIVTKLQDFQDEQRLQNNNKIDSVRRVIEENAQISIWD